MPESPLRPNVHRQGKAVEVAEDRVDLGAHDRTQERLQIQLPNMRSVVLENVVIGGGQQIQPLGRGHDRSVPHGKGQMHVKVRGDEPRGVHDSGQREVLVGSLSLGDRDLLMVQGVFGAPRDIHVVLAHGKSLEFTPGGGHQEVLKPAHDRHFRAPVGVGEVEARGQVNPAPLLQDLEGELAGGQIGLQDEPLVRVEARTHGSVHVRGIPQQDPGRRQGHDRSQAEKECGGKGGHLVTLAVEFIFASLTLGSTGVNAIR